MDSRRPSLLEVTVDNVLKEFEKMELELKQRMEDLQAKRELLNAQMEGEMVTVWMMDSWSSADTLSKKEEILSKSRKEKNEVDISIVEIYEKLTSLQLQRISATLIKLKVLHSKAPHQSCPAEYTMDRFNEWMKNSTQLNKLQSEILGSLSKKVRLTQEKAEEEESQLMDKETGICSFDLRKKFEKLRQKEFAHIESQFVIDKRFAHYIHQLLDINGFNFEAMKLREYIDQCNAETDQSEDSSVSPNNYQSFICALSQYLLDKYGADNFPVDIDAAARLDQTYTLVEGILFPQVQQSIEPFLQSQREKDMALSEKYEAFSKLNQSELGIKDKFVDGAIFPHCKAISHITKMMVANTPSQKLKCILAAAHEIIEYMNSSCCQETVPGADEFMDIWVYVLLKARLPNFFSTVVLLRGYSNPRIGLSESGYYLASFELAGEYIRTLPTDFQAIKSKPCSNNRESEEVFFVPEVTRFTKFMNGAKECFVIVQDEFCLNGFRLVADVDLQLERGRVFTTFLEADLSRHVNGCLVRCVKNVTINNKWLKTQMKKLSPDVSAEVIDGVIVPLRLASTRKDEYRAGTYKSSLSKRYIEIPSGKYDDHRKVLQRYLSLERLGFVQYTVDKTRLVNDDFIFDLHRMESLVQNLEHSFLDGLFHSEVGNIDEAIAEKVKDIQTRLRKFNCYSNMLPIDGVYGIGTCHSLRLFKSKCNDENVMEEDFQFQINDTCDLRTYEYLCST